MTTGTRYLGYNYSSNKPRFASEFQGNWQMTQLQDRFSQPGTAARTGAAVDEGLRSYMLSVYNYMSAGVVLTGITAYVVSALAVASNAAAKWR